MAFLSTETSEKTITIIMHEPDKKQLYNHIKYNVKEYYVDTQCISA